MKVKSKDWFDLREAKAKGILKIKLPYKKVKATLKKDIKVVLRITP